MVYSPNAEELCNFLARARCSASVRLSVITASTGLRASGCATPKSSTDIRPYSESGLWISRRSLKKSIWIGVPSV